MAWSDQATTAADAVTLQMFRDLFAKEALRPNEQIVVGNLSVLFTDLKGSTELYRRIGDAVAFGLVLDHFEILKLAVAKFSGTIVKTIGDAVMAVFKNPVNALKAILEVQKQLFDPLILKSGIHYGPCIAVNLNNRMDYFGSTINLTARLESLSTGGDIVISDKMRIDPEVAYFLARDRQLEVTEFATQLKGFADNQFKLWRVGRKES